MSQTFSVHKRFWIHVKSCMHGYTRKAATCLLILTTVLPVFLRDFFQHLPLQESVVPVCSIFVNELCWKWRYVDRDLLCVAIHLLLPVGIKRDLSPKNKCGYYDKATTEKFFRVSLAYIQSLEGSQKAD